MTITNTNNNTTTTTAASGRFPPGSPTGSFLHSFQDRTFRNKR